MTPINQLNSVDRIFPQDQFPFYQNGNGYLKRVAASIIAEFVASTITVSDNKISQYSAPLTGMTIQINDSSNSVWLILTPAGTLGALTLRMPLLSNTVDKQELLVNCTQTITALTFDGNGSSVIGAPGSLSADGFFRLRYDAVLSTWYRVG